MKLFLLLEQCSWGLPSSGIWCHITRWSQPQVLRQCSS